MQPDESKRRIDARSRDCESGITLDYLQRLYTAYEDFIKDISRIIPVIRVNYAKFRTADEMVDMIIRYENTFLIHFRIILSKDCLCNCYSILLDDVESLPVIHFCNKHLVTLTDGCIWDIYHIYHIYHIDCIYHIYCFLLSI